MKAFVCDACETLYYGNKYQIPHQATLDFKGSGGIRTYDLCDDCYCSGIVTQRTFWALLKKFFGVDCAKLRDERRKKDSQP